MSKIKEKSILIDFDSLKKAYSDAEAALKLLDEKCYVSARGDLSRAITALKKIVDELDINGISVELNSVSDDYDDLYFSGDEPDTDFSIGIYE